MECRSRNHNCQYPTGNVSCTRQQQYNTGNIHHYCHKHFVQWQQLNNTCDPMEDRTAAENVGNIVNASTSVWLTANDGILANASTSVQHEESIGAQGIANPVNTMTDNNVIVINASTLPSNINSSQNVAAVHNNDKDVSAQEELDNTASID